MDNVVLSSSPYIQDPSVGVMLHELFPADGRHFRKGTCRIAVAYPVLGIVVSRDIELVVPASYALRFLPPKLHLPELA